MDLSVIRIISSLFESCLGMYFIFSFMKIIHKDLKSYTKIQYFVFILSMSVTAIIRNIHIINIKLFKFLIYS